MLRSNVLFDDLNVKKACKSSSLPRVIDFFDERIIFLPKRHILLFRYVFLKKRIKTD